MLQHLLLIYPELILLGAMRGNICVRKWLAPDLLKICCSILSPQFHQRFITQQHSDKLQANHWTRFNILGHVAKISDPTGRQQVSLHLPADRPQVGNIREKRFSKPQSALLGFSYDRTPGPHSARRYCHCIAPSIDIKNTEASS